MRTDVISRLYLYIAEKTDETIERQIQMAQLTAFFPFKTRRDLSKNFISNDLWDALFSHMCIFINVYEFMSLL